MTALKSTGLAKHLAITGSLKAALDGGFIFIYSGTVPATADAVIAGSLLAKISVGGDGTTGLTFSGTADDGVLTKTAAEAWNGNVSTTGTATFFRFAAADPSAASTTDKRLQGTVGTTVLSDIVLTSTALVSGNTQALNLFQIY